MVASINIGSLRNSYIDETAWNGWSKYSIEYIKTRMKLYKQQLEAVSR